MTFSGLVGDLHLGDQKVTLKKLVNISCILIVPVLLTIFACITKHPSFIKHRIGSSTHDSAQASQAMLAQCGWQHVEAKTTKIIENVYPGRSTWNTIMEVWKMIFLFNWVIFRFQPLIFRGKGTPF